MHSTQGGLLDQVYCYRGRWSLSLALRALGVGRGDLVAIQAFTCTAVPEAVSSIGAIPLFIDVGPDSALISPEDLAEKIDGSVKVVIVQHTYGLMADIEKIFQICRPYSIPIIEDCCHLPFSEKTIQRIGQYSVASFFSFEWGKPIPVGVGGLLICFDEKLSQPIRRIASELCPPPYMKRAKIEIQYFCFNLFYSPANFHMLKRIFNYADRIGILEGNHNSIPNGLPSQEMGWTIAPAVQNRLRHFEVGLDLEQHSKKLVTMILRKARFRLLRDSYNVPYMLRFPFLVENKPQVLAEAADIGIEISDWYSTPVDPLSISQCESTGWELRNCTSAMKVSEHVLAFPLNLKTTEVQAARFCNWMNNYSSG